MTQTSTHLLALSLALASGTAAAAPTTEELQKEIQALQQAIQALQKTTPTPAAPADAEPVTKQDLLGVSADLENFKYQVQRDRDTATALSSRGLQISGTIQARAGVSSLATTSASGGVDRRKTSFDVPVAVVGFTGSLFKDYELGRNLNYALRLGASPLGNGTQFVNLLDASLSYAVLPTIDPADNQLNITFGQQLLPFGLEVPATEDLKPVINNARFAGALGLAQRQIGVIARGELNPVIDYGYNYRQPELAYALGLINGNGPNTSDNNSPKDWIARLAYTLPADYNSWLRQATLGASGYFGKANRSVGSGTLVEQGARRRVGLDFTYNHEPLGVTYEHVRGTDGTASGTAAAPVYATVKSRSDTLTLFYNFGEQFIKGYRAQGRFDDWWPQSYQPFVRFDRFDPNVNLTGDRIKVGTLGLNVFFAQTTKLQLNLNRISDPSRSAKAYDELLAQVQFGF